ncbi:MAG: type IV secretion system DNA-binding domain-containing protein [Candidatus Berkelbacteria bacterium]|nr:type IV secretion system DNA-binding domain-containing protein [Candidatus Berkelbacteria bacterium]
MTYILYAIYAVLIIGPIYMIWAISNMSKKMKKIDWLASQEYTLLRVDVPRNNDKSPLAAEQMFAAIHGIFSESAQFQNHLSFEIVSRDKFVQFYIYLPIHLKDFVEGQIYAQYPTVELHEVEDYAQQINVAGRNFAICDLGFNKPDVYPIKQFTDFEVDPISGITSVMSKLDQDEEVWMQIIARPVGDEWQEKGHRIVNAVRAGKKIGGKNLTKVILGGIFGLGKNLLMQAVRPGAEMATMSPEVKLPASVEEALKCIEQKITKLGFETKIRIMALGNDSTSARMKCQNIAAAFKQYNTTNLNGFKIKSVAVDDQAVLKEYLYRAIDGPGEIMNIAELASLYHFPHSSVATPNIVWSGSKKGEPPANLPLRSNVPADDFTVLGLSNFRNQLTEFGIKTSDRRRHIYIVGKSGTGKSTLIENMVINDINAGRGVIVVDPHGELVDKIVQCIPDHRVEDIIVFDPADRDFPIAFNLLENVEDDFKGLIASGFVGIFKKIFGDSWGPRLEHILRNTVLALLDYPNSTMLDIPRMLTNNRYRDKVVEVVKDPVIRDFWINEFAAYDNKFRTEAVSPILNKVGQFLSTATIRNIVGQPKTRLNIREAMDQKKVVLVNLSRGKIGEDNSALLGAMVITKIQLAAMSRADVTAENRPDCFLYVDEFQNFATESFSTILSEARKYNLSLTIAHQYIAQMIDQVRDAVFGNAGTLISFRVGGTDATTLVKEYAPVFDENDLVNLDAYHTYIKLLIDGIAPPAFSALMLPPVAKLSGNKDKVIEITHNNFSSTRAEVEDQINNRGSQEDEDAKREAELFKSGGLEALLLKKSQSPTIPTSSSYSVQNNTSLPAQPKPIEQPSAPLPMKPAEILPKPEEKPSGVPIIEDHVASPENAEDQKEEQQIRVVKYQNILDGKLYKERTARGNVKWYIGEEINDEKLAKSGLELDDNGRKMVGLSKKVSTSHTALRPSYPDQHSKQAEEKKSESEKESKLVETSKEIIKTPVTKEQELPRSQDEFRSEKQTNEATKASTTEVSKSNSFVLPNETELTILPQALPAKVENEIVVAPAHEIEESGKQPEEKIIESPARDEAPKTVGNQATTLNHNVSSQVDYTKSKMEKLEDNVDSMIKTLQSSTYQDAKHLEEGKSVKLDSNDD